LSNFAGGGGRRGVPPRRRSHEHAGQGGALHAIDGQREDDDVIGIGVVDVVITVK